MTGKEESTRKPETGRTPARVLLYYMTRPHHKFAGGHRRHSTNSSEQGDITDVPITCVVRESGSSGHGWVDAQLQGNLASETWLATKQGDVDCSNRYHHSYREMTELTHWERYKGKLRDFKSVPVQREQIGRDLSLKGYARLPRLGDAATCETRSLPL